MIRFAMAVILRSSSKNKKIFYNVQFNKIAASSFVIGPNKKAVFDFDLIFQ